MVYVPSQTWPNANLRVLARTRDRFLEAGFGLDFGGPQARESDGAVGSLWVPELERGALGASPHPDTPACLSRSA